MEQKLAQLQAKIEADSSFVENLFGMENPEEVQGLLQAEGLEFTVEELTMLREALIKHVEKGQNDELSDEDLEDVAGGFVITAGVVSAAAGVASAIFGAGSFVNNVTRGRW